MKSYNHEEIERLFSELEKYGYVFPSCVRWNIEDLKCQAEDAGVNLDDKTDEELSGILEDILEQNEDWIMEAINLVISNNINEED